ncbi:MAG: hypothetical protein A3J75_06435 [Acidobacteria bacterium RBG_16_68_9]|nr:MAG: hypothetical protein A3J75_06435 [Acidobacteria bacterium RBG_16_68_9]
MILVVDDAVEVLRSIRALLSREGHTVLTATSADEALALFKQHEVHLLLLDYLMPGMTAAQMIRSVRALDPFVQIILQTGYVDDRPARAMMAELDIQGYHDKADGPEKLLVWVGAGLKTHRLVTSLRERERLQNELVANVSHELCTPLHIISGYTELLREGEFGELPAAAVRPLRSVAEATHTLSELVTDFLRYAKIESGVTELDQHWMATAEVARELKRLASFLIEGKEVGCSVDLEGAPVALVTDSVKVRTILRNLVTNAAKFTARGAITLRFRIREETVRIAVSDTGVGIAPEDQERIFDPFRQLDESLTREHRGVGLGLALSRRLARILGGDVEVESQVGVGSTFTLVLPGSLAAGPEVHGPRLGIPDGGAYPAPWALAEEH